VLLLEASLSQEDTQLGHKQTGHPRRGGQRTRARLHSATKSLASPPAGWQETSSPVGRGADRGAS
jgi:hypothetical protein